MSSANWTDPHTVSLGTPPYATSYLFCGYQTDKQRALVKGLIQLCVDGRSTLYHLPELAEVSNHGGARINNKAMTLLRKFVAANGIEDDLVGEVVGKTGPRTPSPKKDKKDGKDQNGKKRKRVKVDQDEQEEVEDLKPVL